MTIRKHGKFLAAFTICFLLLAGMDTTISPSRAEFVGGADHWCKHNRDCGKGCERVQGTTACSECKGPQVVRCTISPDETDNCSEHYDNTDVLYCGTTYFGSGGNCNGKCNTQNPNLLCGVKPNSVTGVDCGD